jgi:hypothetical protein
MPAKMNIYDIDGMIARHPIRQCIPGFRKVVADMANMADGEVAAFDDAIERFMTGRLDLFHKKAID